MFRRYPNSKLKWKKGDRSVEQSVEAKAQGEAPALQNVSGSVALAPQMPQFSAQFAQQMVVMFQQMAGDMLAQAPLQTPVVQPQAPIRQYDKLLKYGAIEFKGTVDPLEAEQWLERMDRVFKKLHCPKKLKFEYSMSLL